jgi:integrase
MNVTILIRARIGNKYPYLPVATQANGRLKAGFALLDGVETQVTGSYYIRFTEDGIRRLVCVSEDAAEARAAAERKSRELKLAREARSLGIGLPQKQPAAPQPNGLTLAEAAKKYFANMEASGRDQKTISSYHTGIDPFIAQCGKTYVREAEKQDLIDFMGWLRRQPAPKRKHGNPKRTQANKVGYVTIFLKAFGISNLLKKSEYPQYAEKVVSAHTDEELEYLYSHADAEQQFLLDFALASGFRDGELSHAEYSDLVGSTLEVKEKPHLDWHPKKHHCRKVTVPKAFADAWRARAKRLGGSLVFANGYGKPDHHLLRRLQAVARNARFHTELHKLRKTWATRLAIAGMPVHVLQRLLGHKSLEYTQKYLADVDLTQGKMNDTIEAASYVPSPKAA